MVGHMARGATMVALMATAAYGADYRQVTFTDDTGFDRPVPAYRAEVPAGWQTSGGVTWNQTLCTPMMTAFAAEMTGAGHTMAIHPTMAWIWSSMHDQMGQAANQYGVQVCPTLPLTEAKDILAEEVRQSRPGATVVGTDRQDVPVPRGGQAMGSQQSANAAELEIEYTENGQPMRELFVTVALVATAPMPQGYYRQVIVPHTFSLKGPAASFDRAPLEKLVETLTINPDYERRLMAVQNQANAAQSRANANMARETARTGQAISRMQGETAEHLRSNSTAAFQNRMESMDRIGEMQQDTTFGERRFVDQYGDQVFTPDTADRAWDMGNGDYVISNDPTYDGPLNGQEMDAYDYGRGDW